MTSTTTFNPRTTGRVVEIPIDMIAPNPYQPRRNFEEAEMDELAASIRQNGLLQPIVVRRASSRNGFELVAGERRWRALERLGMGYAPAIVREEVSDRSMLVLALVENVQRQSINPIDEAVRFRQAIDEFGMTQAELAEEIGKPDGQPYVSNRLRLLKLPEGFQQLVADGTVLPTHARALITWADEEHGARFFQILETMIRNRGDDLKPMPGKLLNDLTEKVGAILKPGKPATPSGAKAEAKKAEPVAPPGPAAEATPAEPDPAAPAPAATPPKKSGKATPPPAPARESRRDRAAAQLPVDTVAKPTHPPVVVVEETVTVEETVVIADAAPPETAGLFHALQRLLRHCTVTIQVAQPAEGGPLVLSIAPQWLDRAGKQPIPPLNLTRSIDEADDVGFARDVRFYALGVELPATEKEAPPIQPSLL